MNAPGAGCGYPGRHASNARPALTQTISHSRSLPDTRKGLREWRMPLHFEVRELESRSLSRTQWGKASSQRNRVSVSVHSRLKAASHCVTRRSLSPKLAHNPFDFETSRNDDGFANFRPLSSSFISRVRGSITPRNPLIVSRPSAHG